MSRDIVEKLKEIRSIKAHTTLSLILCNTNSLTVNNKAKSGISRVVYEAKLKRNTGSLQPQLKPKILIFNWI